MSYPYKFVPAHGVNVGEISTFDTETVGLGGELICITVHSPSVSDTPFMLSGPSMIDDFLDLCETVGGTWWAHNLSYDLRRLVNAMIDKYGVDLKIMMRTSSDCFGINAGKSFKMRDSYALFPHSLKTFASTYAPDFEKLEIDDIKHFNINDPAHVAYALRDAEALYKVLVNYLQMLQSYFKVDVSNTLAACALKAWQATLGDEVFWPENGEAVTHFSRGAYYGGLTGLTTTAIMHNCKTYDINSSYPFVMASFGVPSATEGHAFRTNDIEDFDLSFDATERVGFVDVTVRTPEDLIIPILPSRNEKGVMIWRRGEFRTMVTSAELGFALKNGYELIIFHDGMCYPNVIYPFGKFVDKCKSMRKEFKGKPQEMVAKLIQNSLYGKFGTRPERFTVKVLSDDESREGWSITDLSDRVFSKIEEQKDVQAKPSWSAWITARARLQLLSLIYELGPENVLYFDTDSVTVSADCNFPEDLIDSTEYGKWKLEKTWRVFRAVAPKVYGGVLVDGTALAKAKGLPFSRIEADIENVVEKMIAGEKVSISYEGITSFGVFMTGGRNQFSTHRAMSSLERSPNWEVFDNGNVRPRDAASDSRTTL